MNRPLSAITSISFLVADVTTFHTDDVFDAAVSFSALHWVSDLHTAIGQIRDVLRPASTLVIGMGGAHQKEIAEVFTRERWRSRISQRARTFHGRTQEELSEILKKTGLSNVHVDSVQCERPYRDETALLDWIMAWLPHATGLSHDDALEFGRDIVDNVRATQPAGQGGLVLHSTMLIAQATRIVTVQGVTCTNL